MHNELFLVDSTCNHEYTYSQLIRDISNKNYVSKYCEKTVLYDIILEILSSIVYGVDIVLLDCGFSEGELNELGLDKDDLKVIQYVKDKSITSGEDLTDSLITPKNWNITLFTSGTTGLPKKVVHSFNSLTRFVKLSEKHTKDVWGLAYNPTHIAGLQVILQAVLNLNTIVNLFCLNRKDVFSLMRLYSLTHISATPTFYRLLLPIVDSYPSILKLTSGGERFDSRMTMHLSKSFPNAKFRNIYASTEVGSVLEAIDDVFTICDDSICKIVNDELYVNRPLLGFDSSNEEWYKTGDLVEVIEENPTKFRFLMRSNEMINVGGNKVNPEEVERVLENMVEIKKAIVYGKPNPLVGNILMADVIVVKKISEKKLRDYLRDKLLEYKIPRVINYVDTINITRSGKVSRCKDTN